MLLKHEPLLLIKGGYWTLASLPGWYTDINVVVDAETNGLLKRLPLVPKGTLDGRNITITGMLFAKRLETDLVAEAQQRGKKKNQKVSERKREQAIRSFRPDAPGSWMDSPRAVFLPDMKGIWRAKNQFSSFGLDAVIKPRVLLLRCNFCGRMWAPAALKTNDYWRCENGCNSILVLNVVVREV
jgi:hypothetical protein